MIRWYICQTIIRILVRYSISHLQRSYNSQRYHGDDGLEKFGQCQRSSVSVVAFTSVDGGATVGIICLYNIIFGRVVIVHAAEGRFGEILLDKFV
jgi:hypothetical protein